MQPVQTFQETVDASVAERNRSLLNSASPKAASHDADLRKQAAELEAAADAELAQKVSGVRKIESLLNRQSALRTEVEALQNLAALAANSKLNIRTALSFYVAREIDPFSARNWITATDEIMRAAMVAGEIPGVVSEKQAELDAAQAEITTIATTHGFDLVKVFAALKAPRGPSGEIVYTL